jgi:hypothetical protein
MTGDLHDEKRASRGQKDWVPWIVSGLPLWLFLLTACLCLYRVLRDEYTSFMPELTKSTFLG